MAKDIPFNEVVKELRSKFKTVKVAKEKHSNMKCDICKNKIADIGLSKIRGVCVICASLSMLE
jgi:hypothetical protein